MRLILQAISWTALALTISPSVLFLLRRMELDRVKLITLAASIVWFAATPLWMGRENTDGS